MIITKKHLSRRTFLRGSFGAAMALPLLDAMVPALTAQSRTAARTPFRFGAVYMPNGVYPDTWHPATVGSDFEFKPVMQPLEGFRDQLVTVSKMKAPWGESVHLGASSAFLNGVGPVGSKGAGGDAFGKIESKKTVDQFIADTVADDTPLRSIEVGTEDMGTAVGACDGFPCTFFNALSWRDDVSPLPIGINPRVTFERMFGETGSTEQRTARLKEKQSLLDSVMAETSKLRSTLGAPDRAILDCGTKVLTSDQYTVKGFGHVMEYPEAVVATLSEEHGVVDLSACPERPAVGDVVEVVPNHCCVVSNMVDEVYGVRDGRVEAVWPVAARGTVR